MPGQISTVITNALLLLSTTPATEHTPTLMDHMHRRLQGMMGMPPGATPQQLVGLLQTTNCQQTARYATISQYSSQAVSMGLVADSSEATTLLNSAFDCACSARVDDPAITTLFNTVMSVMQQQTAPDMQAFVNQVADVVPAILSSGLLCSRDCQTAWKTLARFGLDTSINNRTLGWAQTISIQHGLPGTDAKVPLSMITTTANSMVDCMCGGIDYRAFITPAIPYIMQQLGDMTVPQLFSDLPSLPVSQLGRRLQGSAPSPPSSSTVALDLATTYVPLVFGPAFLCGGRCKESMENVMELGARTATILATAQLRQTGATATAISRVVDVNRLAPGAAETTANCLCGTDASFDWAGLITLGFEMASADRFDVSLVKRVLKRTFGGRALCGGSCPAMMSSMGQISATLLEGFSRQQIIAGLPHSQYDVLPCAVYVLDPVIHNACQYYIGRTSAFGGQQPTAAQVHEYMNEHYGHRLPVGDTLFGFNMTSAGVTAVHNIVTNMPQCICSPNFNWDGLVNSMEPPIRSMITTGSPGQLPITSMLTDSGGCASSHCTSVTTDAFQLMTSITAAQGAPELPTCTRDTAATCTSRCFRCTQDEPAPQPNASLETYLRESGYSPAFVQRTVGSGPSRGGRAEIMSRFMHGGPKLDAEGVPCSSECQSTCVANSAFIPICSLSQSCPPPGVAGFRVKFRANLAMTRVDFTEALQTEYKTNVAEMFNGRGADVNESMIELEIADATPAGRRLTASAQISVTSSVSVGSPIAQAIVTNTISNLTASSMNTFLGSSFVVTDVADPTLEEVSGTTGTINAPAGGTADSPSSPSSGSGTNTGLIIGAIAGGVVAGALITFLVCYFLGRRTATPMVAAGPTVATEKPTSGLVTNPEKTVSGYM